MKNKNTDTLNPYAPAEEGLPLFDLGVPHSGNGCPDTSYIAADRFKGSAKTLRNQVYMFIKSKGEEGATAYDVFLNFGLDKNKTSPRISELKNHGFVVDTGERRAAPGCGKSVVWRAR